ncbi:MAG: hypothetical protein LBV75_04480, partial [Paludibacter sp.]|nr:hypothetical protein [Paludibacter sp.]
CIRSILAPIEFENKKTERQEIVIQQLIDIRTAQLEYKAHKGIFAADWDELISFLRDTTQVKALSAIFPDKRYTCNNIDKICVVPFSNGKKFVLKTNNEYTTSAGIQIPLFEVSAEYTTFLTDINGRELRSLIDITQKLDKFEGLKIGSIEQPNNNAGNWE